MSQKAKIFLSYASEDHERVSPLYERLAQEGFQPWMDRRDILPGEKYEVSIAKALKEADFFVSLLSRHSVAKRGYVQVELKRALAAFEEMLEEDIYVIPARLEPCDVPESLSKFHYVDLFETDGWSRMIRAFTTGMERKGVEGGERT